MAYTPTEWATGDVITAEKLNNMEQGIEDAFVAPAVTIADEGDVLTVNSSGAWAAAAPASQLPAVTSSDAGDVLTVNSSGEWAAAAPASQLPSVTAADQGKVLTVDSSGDWDAAALPENAVIFEGVVSSDNGTSFTFTLTSGDVSDLAFAENIYIKADLVIASAKMAELIIPLRSLGFSNGVANGYNFMSVMSMSTGVYHARITYSISQEHWTVALTKLD